MIANQTYSRLRIINLLLPKSSDPLLTPYNQQLNKRIIPLKRRYQILSNRTQGIQIIKSEVQLTKKDKQKIMRSYSFLKMTKKANPQAQTNKYLSINDQKYKKLIQIRKSMIKERSLQYQQKNLLQPNDMSQVYLKDINKLNLKNMNKVNLKNMGKVNLKNMTEVNLNTNRIFRKSSSFVRGKLLLDNLQILQPDHQILSMNNFQDNWKKIRSNSAKKI